MRRCAKFQSLIEKLLDVFRGRTVKGAASGSHAHLILAQRYPEGGGTELAMPATHGETEHQHDGGASAAISTAVVHLLREYTGRGPTKAKTYVNPDMVTVVLQDILTKGERSLVSDGKRDSVLSTRHLYQETMQTAMVETVEQVTGRSVVAFMSANHIDPDVAVETFMLAPVVAPVEEA